MDTATVSLGVKDFLRRVRKQDLFFLAIMTVINSFISVTFAAITMFASNLTNENTTADILLFCTKFD